jgi:hypothetical protein
MSSQLRWANNMDEGDDEQKLLNQVLSLWTIQANKVASTTWFAKTEHNQKHSNVIILSLTLSLYLYPSLSPPPSRSSSLSRYLSLSLSLYLYLTFSV